MATTPDELTGETTKQPSASAYGIAWSQHTNIKPFEIARRFAAAATTCEGPSRSSADRLDEMWQNAHLAKVEEKRVSTGDPLVS